MGVGVAGRRGGGWVVVVVKRPVTDQAIEINISAAAENGVCVLIKSVLFCNILHVWILRHTL